MDTFRPFIKSRGDLLTAARVAVRSSLQLKQGERVLIITNPAAEVAEIAFALHDAAAEAGAAVLLLFQQTKTQLDFCEREVAAAISAAPDVVISLSAEKLGKDREAVLNPHKAGGKEYDSTFHYLLHGVKRVRGFWSPHVTVDCFVRTVPIDYEELKADCGFVKKLLDEAESLRITNKNGTDIVIGTLNRRAFVDDGDFSLPGTGGNLPAGESFLSPALGTARGTIVFDGSIAGSTGEILIETPLSASVEKGFITGFSGGKEADLLLSSVEQGERNAQLFEENGRIPKGKGEIYRKNARNIGELGIGLNRKARITGNMLEDEKVYGTCHFAIGSNYDEDAPALIHLDGLVSGPTITAVLSGGKTRLIMDEGNLIR